MSANELIWTPGYDSDLKEFVPMRNYRRYTRVDNSFTDRNKCQKECDSRNSPDQKYKPLEFATPSPPKNKLI